VTGRFDIVLFLAGSLDGITASEVKLVEQDHATVTYTATFIKPQAQAELEGQTTIDEQIDELNDSQATVEIGPDTSPTPEGVDYDELEDLP
jgi:hypothetical protein